MSIVNSVLKDIEIRASNFTPIEIAAIAGVPRRKHNSKRLKFAGLFLLPLALAGWLVYENRSERRNNSATTAAEVEIGDSIPPQPTNLLSPFAAAPVTGAIDPSPVLGMRIREDAQQMWVEIVLRDDDAVLPQQRGRDSNAVRSRPIQGKIASPEVHNNRWIDGLEIVTSAQGVNINLKTAPGVSVETYQRVSGGESIWAINLQSAAAPIELESLAYSAPMLESLDAAGNDKQVIANFPEASDILLNSEALVDDGRSYEGLVTTAEFEIIAEISGQYNSMLADASPARSEPRKMADSDVGPQPLATKSASSVGANPIGFGASAKFEPVLDPLQPDYSVTAVAVAVESDQAVTSEPSSTAQVAMLIDDASTSEPAPATLRPVTAETSPQVDSMSADSTQPLAKAATEKNAHSEPEFTMKIQPAVEVSTGIEAIKPLEAELPGARFATQSTTVDAPLQAEFSADQFARKPTILAAVDSIPEEEVPVESWNRPKIEIFRQANISTGSGSLDEIRLVPRINSVIEQTPIAAASPADSEAESTSIKLEITSINPMTKSQLQLESASELVNAGRYPKAESLLRGLIGGDADYNARKQLLVLHKRQRRSDRLKRLLRDSIATYPGDRLFTTEYARVLFNDASYHDAIQLLIQQERLEVDQLALVAASYQRLGQHDDAIKYYRLALAQDAANTKNWIGLAISQEHESAFNDALDSYQRARQIGNLNNRLQAFVEKRSARLRQTLN